VSDDRIKKYKIESLQGFNDMKLNAQFYPFNNSLIDDFEIITKEEQVVRDDIYNSVREMLKEDPSLYVNLFRNNIDYNNSNSSLLYNQQSTYGPRSISTMVNNMINSFKSSGFPSSYWKNLVMLKIKHPNWEFNAVNTGLDFDEAVSNEFVGDRCLIDINSPNGRLCIEPGYGPCDGNNWYKANKQTIAYYMDPRNFLNDKYVSQFEMLTYDDSISDEEYLKSIQTLLEDDYLGQYSQEFLEAGKKTGVNPIYLASLSKQEVSNGANAGTATRGTNGVYNFYNIGATHGSNPVYNGLNYASATDSKTMRPWNTPEKAIVGGSQWIYNAYLDRGLDTSYFKKFNVVNIPLTNGGKVTNPYPNYQNQYMANVMAPSSEALMTYNSQGDISGGMAYTFNIPVYDNMPTSTSLPTGN